MQEFLCLKKRVAFSSVFSLSRGYACFGKSRACVGETLSQEGKRDDEELGREELVFRGMDEGAAEREGMMEENSDGRSENTGELSHTEENLPENKDKESQQKNLHLGEQDTTGKEHEEELEEKLEEEVEEELEDELEEEHFNTANKADTTDNADCQNEEKSCDELILVEKRKMWRKPAGQVQAMPHGKWTKEGGWRMEKRGKTQSELLKEELKTTVLQLGANPLREEVELEEQIWKEFKQMVEEKTAEENMEAEKWAKAKADRLAKEFEEETKRLANLSQDGQLEYEMIEKIRKRVYMTAEEREEEELEARLAHIKEKEGTLRPSLFANVPPFLRFVPTDSLPGDVMRERALSEAMGRMGWYNWERDQDRNVVGWAVQDCIEYNGFKLSQVFNALQCTVLCIQNLDSIHR